MPAEITRVTSWSAIVLAALTASTGTGLTGIRYNAPAPNFAIPATAGAHSLSDLRGRVVLEGNNATLRADDRIRQAYLGM